MRSQAQLFRHLLGRLPHIQGTAEQKQNSAESVMLSTQKGLGACSGKVGDGLCQQLLKIKTIDCW